MKSNFSRKKTLKRVINEKKNFAKSLLVRQACDTTIRDEIFLLTSIFILKSPRPSKVTKCWAQNLGIHPKLSLAKVTFDQS